MNFINKLEKKIGRYAISNLSLCLIICYGFGYAINFVNADFLNYLTLNPYRVLHGEIWRIVTWILVPPSSFDLFTVIMLYFYYSIGTSLERTWGTFYYNLYIFSGMLFTVLGSFLLFACTQTGLLGAEYLQAYGTEFYNAVGILFNTYYINMSIFLAFAATFPDVQVLLMFIIPVKVKWLGIMDGVLLAYSFVMGNFITKFVIASSLMGFLVFYLLTRNLSYLTPKQIKRRSAYRKQVRPVSRGITKHKCAICGRTEMDDPTLEFRFCSKCDGNYEYCQEHLFTHEHVRRN